MSREELRRQEGSEKRHRERIPRVVIAGAFLVFILAGLYNTLVFERAPHIHDEMVYLFQARIFLTGHVYAASPCAAASFDFPHMINNGKWFSIYPPGFPFLLMLGLLFKAPYLINPIFGALSILIIYLLGRELYDRRTGTAAALLGTISPWLLLMSSTMMSHTPSMFFNALFLLFLLRSIKKPTVSNGVLAGAALGMAFITRPINAAIFSLTFLLYFAYVSVRSFPKRFKNLLGFALAGAIFVGILLAYNLATTGDPLIIILRIYRRIESHRNQPSIVFYPGIKYILPSQSWMSIRCEKKFSCRINIWVRFITSWY